MAEEATKPTLNLPGPLVTSEWLAENHQDVRVVDARWAMAEGPKRHEYLQAHIPGAVFVDLDSDLSDPPGKRGRHPLPTPTHFATARGRLGLVRRPVVVYDDSSGSVAARLWWMLDAIGHPVAVLDGGLTAWRGDVEAGDVTVEPEQAPVVPWPVERFVEADDVLPAIADGSVLLDARSADRFDGRPNPIDQRPGHMPGATSRPWTDNLDSDGRMASPEQLRSQLTELGVGDDTDLIASCGSGVTGCHDLLAARIAGFPTGRLYAGSWSEWGLDPERPVNTNP